MTDQELFAEMGADLFVGGAETTTNALSHGVMLLIEHPEVWQAVKADPENMVPRFAEEVLRLEAPVQSLRRVATVDIELHGVTIPAGALINLRYGAANRDERAFECPESINLERKNPRSHLAFGTGAHVCLGAPLARRELYLSFHALVDRVDELRFIDGVSTFEHPVNYSLRGLKQLQVEFSTTLAV
jgi:cytochrome P450